MHKDMKNDRKTAKELLRQQKVGATEAARLILEAVEGLGEMCTELKGAGLMTLLRQVVQAGVAAVKARTATVSFEEAAWASVRAREDRRASTKQDLRHFVRRMLRVPGVAERPLRAMTTRECRALLEAAFGASKHSYRKARSILHSIFTYGYRQEWCDENPVNRIETPSVPEIEIIPLTPEECKRLEATAERPEHAPMRLSLHLLMYGGLRPAEVQRLDPARDIDWKEGTVHIRPQVSKTGGGRTVHLHKLPRRAVRAKGGIIPPNWPKRWRALRRAAGFRRWQSDALRHTFATYHALRFRSLPELQLEMGHSSTNLLRNRYLNPTRTAPRSAQRFWT